MKIYFFFVKRKMVSKKYRPLWGTLCHAEFLYGNTLFFRRQPAFMANGIPEPNDIDDEVDDIHGRLGIFVDAEIAHHEIEITHDPYDIAELEAQCCVIIGSEKRWKDNHPADTRIEEPIKIRVETIIHDGQKLFRLDRWKYRSSAIVNRS